MNCFNLKELFMRTPFLVLLMLVFSLLLAGCPQGSRVPPSLERVFPTVTPTIVPSPTPTREDEIVIPFETIVLGTISSLSQPLEQRDSEIVTNFVVPTSEEFYQGPFTFLITSPNDVDLIQPWVSSTVLDVIKEDDFEQFAFVAVFPGSIGAPTKVYVKRIATGSIGNINIHVVFEIASAGLPVDTLPGHIVRIHRQDISFPLSANVEIQLETETVLLN
jgi:hypothetical protein